MVKKLGEHRHYFELSKEKKWCEIAGSKLLKGESQRNLFEMTGSS